MDKAQVSINKSGTLFTSDVNETQVEVLKKAKQQFVDTEKLNLQNQIQDLQMTLEINKSIICDLLCCKTLSQVEGAVLRKMNEENLLLRNRIQGFSKCLDDANAQILVLQQINSDVKHKEQENIQMYEDQLTDLKDKLERKEYFMQNKERKWLEVEKILEEYVEEDDELRDKLYELRVNVHTNKKITNVVVENDKLKYELDEAHEEISRLRKQLLTIGMGIIKQGSKGSERGSRLNTFSYNNPNLDGKIEEEDADEYSDEDEEGQRSMKKVFLSTAPINFQAIGGGLKNQLKIKESKAELKHYSHKLEEVLSKLKQQYIEIEKDHEILNKTYMKELKKGDGLSKALQKVKNLILTTLTNQKLCVNCSSLTEVEELKKTMRDRMFDASNEGETSMDNMEMSFNKDEGKQKCSSQVVNMTRGQGGSMPLRSRQMNGKISQLSNKLNHIIAEEELDVKEYNMRSPFTGGMESNKISAIGLGDMRKDSPFWDHDGIFEFQQSFNKNPFEVGKHHVRESDEFRH